MTSTPTPTSSTSTSSTSASTSGRLRPLDIHRHDEPPGVAASSGRPDGDDAAAAVPAARSGAGRLWREGGKVLYSAAGATGSAPDAGVDAQAEPVAVRVLWARPLSGRAGAGGMGGRRGDEGDEAGGAVSLMLAGKKREAAYLPSLDVLDGSSRQVAEEELSRSMVLPRITRLRAVRPRFGNYYFDVETDRGGRRFLLSSPEVNSLRPRPDVVVLKDVSGNTYEIPSVSGLDAASRRELERVL